MDRFLLFFFRLLTMALGFFVACMVTGTALAFLTRVITPEDVRTLGSNETVMGLMVGILAVAAVVAYAAMLPAMFIVLFAEIRRKRDWLFYCASGALIAVLCLSFVLLNPQQDSAPSLQFFAIVVVAGMLGGVAYWLVAGRQAGGWLPRQIKRARLERKALEESERSEG
ncbi:hypothetical protein [Pararhizobium haloflavum]|uniref:hypothetical protein n=1 Tax=Pararhizobium haloflavum TaxID=2037914 RepID=UPI000C192EC1|nr:hypothetical protein [Pararhizobium haloflavum]